MLVTDILLLPVRGAQLAGRALDDLNALAERARREPDPVEEIRERIDLLLVELAALIVVAREIVEGGDDLHQTTKVLDGHVAELDGHAAELVAAARIFTGVLPRLLEGLDTVEGLEEAVETVAETVEPLQGAAERVGRVTSRLTRS